MKIGITSLGKSKDSKIDTRFGRSSNILIFSEERQLEKSMANPGAQAQRGAGVQAAQKLVDEEVNVLITGNIGPNALNLLQQSNIEIYLTSAGISAKEAFEKYNSGDLKKAEEATGPPRRGRGGGRGRGSGAGRGQGRGRGRRRK